MSRDAPVTPSTSQVSGSSSSGNSSGATTAAFVNDPASPLAKAAHWVFPLCAGAETSVALLGPEANELLLFDHGAAVEPRRRRPHRHAQIGVVTTGNTVTVGSDVAITFVVPQVLGMEEIGDHCHTTGFDRGGGRVLVLVDHVLVERLGIQFGGVIVHPRADERSEIEPRIAVEHRFVVDDLIRGLGKHAVGFECVLRCNRILARPREDRIDGYVIGVI